MNLIVSTRKNTNRFEKEICHETHDDLLNF